MVMAYSSLNISLAVYAVFVIIGKRIKSSKLIALAKFSGLSVLVNIILFSSIITADSLAQRDTVQAKEFCDTVIHKLEQYKSNNNKYPEPIYKIISSDIILPMRIRNYRLYQTDEERYRFIVPIIYPNVCAYVYESNEKTWELIDFIFYLEGLYHAAVPESASPRRRE